MSWYLRCSWCGGPFNGGNCQRCTNVSFRDEFVRNPDPISYDETPDFSYPPPQPQTHSFDQPTQTSISHLPPKETSVRELLLQEKLHKALQTVCEKLSQQKQAATISTLTPEPSRRFNFFYDDEDDDDDKEITIPLNEITSQIPPSIAITPILLTMEPEDSLITGDIESEDSYVSKLDKPDLLATPLSKLIEDECFDPGGDFVLEEIEACLTSDSIPPGIDDDDFDPEGDILLLEKLLNDDPSCPLPLKELNFEKLKVIKSYISTDFKDDYYDSKGDIIYLESLLIKDTILNLPPEVFLDHDPRSLKDEPNNNDLKSMVKVFDPGIHEEIISPTYVRLPFEDRDYFSLTFVIRIFLPYLTYSMDSSLPLSSGSEDTIFDTGISAFHFSSLEPVVSHRSGTFMCFNVYLNILNESQMEIYSSTCVRPNYHNDMGQSQVETRTKNQRFSGGTVLDHFVEIPFGESKVHIEVLSVLWGNRLPIPDGSLPLSRSVRCRCDSLQKKAHSKNNKSETDKSLLHLVGSLPML
ncbi:hypothetical protein Tco_0320673 [Tanacetum coccineum]